MSVRLEIAKLLARSPRGISRQEVYEKIAYGNPVIVARAIKSMKDEGHLQQYVENKETFFKLVTIPLHTEELASGMRDVGKEIERRSGDAFLMVSRS